jgi:predicted amidohydrolase YtcJ
MVHVMPSPGLSALLDIYARTRQELRLADPRFRVEHAHAMAPEIIGAYASARVIASVQPPLLAKFDELRSKYPYPWTAIRQAGLTVAFGTDSILSSGLVTAMQAIQLALHRSDADGRHITLDEALTFYTRDAAFARFTETRTGSLEPGKLADFVVFDSDLHALPKDELHKARPVLTVVNGAIRYSRPAVAR